MNIWIALAALGLSACVAEPSLQQPATAAGRTPAKSAKAVSTRPAPTGPATRVPTSAVRWSTASSSSTKLHRSRPAKPANAGCPDDPSWGSDDDLLHDSRVYRGAEGYSEEPMTPLHGVPLQQTGLRLLVDGCVIDVDTGVETRTRRKPRECSPSAELVVLPDKSLRQVTRQGKRVKVPSPTTIGDPGFINCPVVSPGGRYVLVEYGHPAWPGPRQRMDLWLYDLHATQWVHVPSMPAPAALKFSYGAWSSDGRLVMLGSFYGVGRALTVWRPGERDLSVRVVDYPNRHGLEVLPSK